MNERGKNSSFIRSFFKSIFTVIHTTYGNQSSHLLLLKKPRNKKILFYILPVYFHLIIYHLICNMRLSINI